MRIYRGKPTNWQ